MIVFEDLKEKDFTMADRNVGLDRHHSELVLSKLAKLHAASYKLAQDDNDAFKKCNFGMVKHDIANPELYIGMFEKGVEALASASETWPEHKIIMQKLKIIQVNISFICCDVCKFSNRNMCVSLL